MQSTLILGAAAALAPTVIYVLVGRAVSERSLPIQDIAANRGFTLWWYSLAALGAVGALSTLAVALGWAGAAWMVSMTYLTVAILCLALYGLTYYLFYVLTGDPRWRTPLATLHILYYALLTHWLTLAEPSGIVRGTWTVRLDYQSMPGGLLAPEWILAGLVVAPLIGGIGYMGFMFRGLPRPIHYRVSLVSSAMVGWLLIGGLAGLFSVSDLWWWPLASRLVALVAAFTVLAAFHPPAPVARWLQAAPARAD